MGTNNAAIQHDNLHIRVIGKMAEHLLPYPASHQRAKRLYTLFHFPYAAGSKRHCAPLRLINNTASMKRRHLRADPLFTCAVVRRNAYIFFHSVSRSLTGFMRLNYASFVNTS